MVRISTVLFRMVFQHCVSVLKIAKPVGRAFDFAFFSRFRISLLFGDHQPGLDTSFLDNLFVLRVIHRLSRKITVQTSDEQAAGIIADALFDCGGSLLVMYVLISITSQAGNPTIFCLGSLLLNPFP